MASAARKNAAAAFVKNARTAAAPAARPHAQAPGRWARMYAAAEITMKLTIIVSRSAARFHMTHT